MGAATDAYIIRDNTGKRFNFRGVAPLKNKKSQPTMSIPFIGTSSANNLLFRFTGQTETISFSFAIFDDGEDVSNGTEGGGVVSVDHQISYLMNTIYGDDYDDKWTFHQTRYAISIECNIEDIEIENSAGGVYVVMGTITLKRGRLGSL